MSRKETTSEHIARDIREGRFPERSEPQYRNPEEDERLDEMLPYADLLTEWQRSLPTEKLMSMANLHQRIAEMHSKRAAALSNLALELARERGEHCGDDPPIMGSTSNPKPAEASDA
jgi:hypothetical protein